MLKKVKKHYLFGPRALSGKYLFEIKKYENLIKENFSDDHLIVLVLIL